MVGHTHWLSFLPFQVNGLQDRQGQMIELSTEAIDISFVLIFSDIVAHWYFAQHQYVNIAICEFVLCTKSKSILVYYQVNLFICTL